MRSGDVYVVHGQKIWISTAQVADRILLLARTTPLEQVARPTLGLSLFYAALDKAHVEARVIDKIVQTDDAVVGQSIQIGGKL